MNRIRRREWNNKACVLLFFSSLQGGFSVENDKNGIRKPKVSNRKRKVLHIEKGPESNCDKRGGGRKKKERREEEERTV